MTFVLQGMTQHPCPGRIARQIEHAAQELGFNHQTQLRWQRLFALMADYADACQTYKDRMCSCELCWQLLMGDVDQTIPLSEDEPF